MTMGSLQDREIQKFTEVDGKPAVDVNIVQGEVTLDAASLAALENITVTVENEVEIKNDSGNPVPANLKDSSGNEITSRLLNDPPTDADRGIITQAVIHGHSTAGGGAFVDVKVTPSGALNTEATVVSSALPTGASTEAKQDDVITALATLQTSVDTLAADVATLKQALVNAPKTRYGNSNTSLAAGASTTIFSQTIASGKQLRLDAIIFSADCYGNWNVTVNGSSFRRHKGPGTELSEVIPFFGEIVPAGNSVVVSVKNESSETGLFTAHSLGELEDV